MLDKKNSLQEIKKSRTEKIIFYFRYWKNFFIIIGLIGALFFIINTVVASFFYTGGSHINPNNPGYSFVWNYVSDLGRIYSLSGELNLISRIIFTSTLTYVGLSIVFYTIAFTNFFKKENQVKIRITALIFGIIYGFEYLIIGYLPLDVHQYSHSVFVITSCLFKIITLVCYSILILKKANYNNFYAYVYICYLVIFFIFFIFLFISLIDVIPFLQTCIIGQKLTFYLEAVLYFIQAIGALKYLYKNQTLNLHDLI